MHHVDLIIERVRSRHPDAVVNQLHVSHPGVDDDGLWSFRLPDMKDEIQIESASYDLPFLIEGIDVSPTGRLESASIDEVVEAVSLFLERSRRRSASGESESERCSRS
jgi:hypothetical protein